MEISIFYEDTDCGGVVYYANYLKYFERARTLFLEEGRFPLSKLMGEGILFTVVHCEIFYRSPARYRETLKIDTDLTEVTRSVISFSHKIFEKSSGRLVVEGTARLVCVGADGKVKRLPQDLIAPLAALVTPNAQ